MSKVLLDRDSFKALASDTRLDIIRSLDGKKLCLNDICNITKLNKATLHVHLTKLVNAGFIKKKGREGHKWVYYKLTWKGESLLHPENTRIVVLFSATFFSLFCAIIQFVNYTKGTIVGVASNVQGSSTTQIYAAEESGRSIFSQMLFFNQVADIPLNNQTLTQLSYELNNNANIRGLIGNSFSDSDISWNAIQLTQNMVFDNNAVSPEIPAVIATVHDPVIMYIAIACFVAFTIVLSISLWRLWDNKTPKL